MPVSIERISKFSFFKGISKERLEEIVQSIDFGLVEEKSMLLRYGAQPAGLIFIESGQLQINEHASDGRVIGIRLLNPGEQFGYLSLIDGLPGTCSIKATKSTGIFLWSMSNVRMYAQKNLDIMERIAKILASDLRRSIGDKSLLSVPNAYHRIFIHIHLLASDVKAFGHTVQLPNQREIASVVNTSRETVSRALQMLIKGGILEKSGHHLNVQKADLLERLAIDGLDALPPSF